MNFIKKLPAVLLLVFTTWIAMPGAFAQAQTGPIQIKTCQELQNIQNNLYGNYVLANDIDCNGFGFVPIGSTTYPYSNPFSGSLSGLANDGQTVYKIENLTILQPNSNAAFFGSIGGVSPQQFANINNLKLTNVNIQAGGNNGAFVAALAIQTLGNTSISNVSINGVVGSPSSSNLAYFTSGAIYQVGVANTATNDVISNVSVNLSTVGDAGDAVSGFVITNYGTIEQCSATNIINTQTNATGFFLVNQGNISNSYVTGSITSTTTSWGFGWTNDGNISDSYTAVAMSTGTDPHSVQSSGFLGVQSAGGTTTNSFWDTQVSGLTYSAAGTGETTANMFENSTYKDWDFGNTWSQYPHLRPIAFTPPVITNQPTSQTVYAPNPVTLSLTATGSAPLTYQWYEYIYQGVSTGWQPISGAMSASYTISQTVAGSYHTFYCVVTNFKGSVQSNVVSVTANAPPVPPSIVTQPPASIIVVEPNLGTLSVVASGTAPLTYQWMGYNAVAPGFVPVGQANTASYTFPYSSSQYNDTYECVVTNAAGSVTSNQVVLTFIEPVSITSQSSSQTIYAPNPVTLTVTASGTTPLAYQWMKYNNVKWIPISGAVSASYTISQTATTDSGQYECVVTNAGSSATSKPLTLTVKVYSSVGGTGSTTAY